MATSRSLFRPPLPREHGSWAALLMPLLAGASWLGVGPGALQFAGAAVSLFFARAAWGHRREAGRTGWALGWLVFWNALALAAAWPLLLAPWGAELVALGVAGMAAEGLTAALGRRGAWRSLLGDLVGTALSALVVFGYALAQTGAMGPEAQTLALLTALFWVGSVVRVRSQLRERTNRRFHAATILVQLVNLAVGAALAGAVALVLAPAAVDTIWLLRRPPRAVPSLRVGVREIVHSVVFVGGVALAAVLTS